MYPARDSPVRRSRSNEKFIDFLDREFLRFVRLANISLPPSNREVKVSVEDNAQMNDMFLPLIIPDYSLNLKSEK